MTESFLQPEDDGLLMRKAGNWTAEKLYYLNRYLDIFTTGMHTQPVRGFHYVDLFAGPGKDRIEESGEVILGSPLLALEQQFPFTNYHFVEIKPPLLKALDRRVSASQLAPRVTFYGQDANCAVEEIVEGIKAVDEEFRPGYHSTLNLAFIDPEGLEAEWNTVEKLTEVKRMDIIIHYPVMALNRNMGIELESEAETAVDKFFGGRDWRRIFEVHASRGNPQAAHRELIDHYRGKLQARSYQEVRVDEREPLMRSGETKVPLYRLIFASKHRLGHDFWEKISGQDPSGQLSFW